MEIKYHLSEASHFGQIYETQNEKLEYLSEYNDSFRSCALKNLQLHLLCHRQAVRTCFQLETWYGRTFYVRTFLAAPLRFLDFSGDQDLMKLVSCRIFRRPRRGRQARRQPGNRPGRGRWAPAGCPDCSCRPEARQNSGSRLRSQPKTSKFLVFQDYNDQAFFLGMAR